MPITLGQNPRSRFNDGTGKPLAQGTVGVYTAGTSFATLATIWDTATKDTELTNPVTLDDAGEAEFWYNVEVDLQIKDSTGAVVDTALALDPNASTPSSTSGTGLAPNGSFENDENNDGTPNDWVLSTYTGSAIAITSSSVSNGANALEFNTGASAFGGGVARSVKFAVTGDKLLDCFWSFYATHATTTNSIVVNWFKADGTSSATASTTMTSPASGSVPTSWTNYREVLSIPSDATQGDILITGIDSGGSNLTEKAYFDGIDFNQKNSITYSGQIPVAGTSVEVPASGIPEFTFTKQGTGSYRIQHDWTSTDYIIQAQSPNDPGLEVGTYLPATTTVTWTYEDDAGTATNPTGSHTFVITRFS